MILGDTHLYENESLNIEFKHFCLQIDQDTIEDVFPVQKMSIDGIITDPMYFNHIVFKNIHYYFKKYIPRYTSAFLNSNIKNAELVMGVDDFSEITGIPYFGTKCELEHKITKLKTCINNYIKCKNGKEVPIVIKIDQLTIEKDYLYDDSDIILKEYYENLNMRKHLLQKYKQDRRKWSNELNKYTCKLPVLIESQRNAFDIYLKKNAQHMLGYLIYEHEMTNISHLKVDPTHYLYWLMEFKKKNVSEIKLRKPIKPNVPKVIHGPDYLIQQLTHMRLKFIKANPNINYFIIHIKFPNDTSQYNPVYYYNIDNNMWSQKKRNFNNDVGPCCL